MKLANHCQLNAARAMLALAKQGRSRSKLNKIIRISKGKMRSCCNRCASKTSKPHWSQPWKSS